jgi:phage terminase Nu1 subunit (DNA packaging protein)
MKRHSISELARLTGYHRATIAARLEGREGVRKGRAVTYTLRQLIDGIAAHQAERSDELSLEQERARLAREQRLKLEREKAAAESKLLDADEVLQMWSHVMKEYRKIINAADVPEELRAELLEGCREIPLEDYSRR